MNFNTLKQFFKNLLTNFKPMDEESTPVEAPTEEAPTEEVAEAPVEESTEEATTEEAPKEDSPSAFCYPYAKEKEAGSDHTDEEKKETE